MVDFTAARPEAQAMRRADRPDLDLIFAALADPTRRAILRLLLETDRPVGELAACFAMSLAAVSKHIQILARAGLVSQRAEGRARICRLEPDALRPAGIWMQGFGGFDPEDYDALERLIRGALERSDGLDEPLGRFEID